MNDTPALDLSFYLDVFRSGVRTHLAQNHEEIWLLSQNDWGAPFESFQAAGLDALIDYALDTRNDWPSLSLVGYRCMVEDERFVHIVRSAVTLMTPASTCLAP